MAAWGWEQRQGIDCRCERCPTPWLLSYTVIQTVYSSKTSTYRLKQGKFYCMQINLKKPEPHTKELMGACQRTQKPVGQQSEHQRSNGSNGVTLWIKTAMHLDSYEQMSCKGGTFSLEYNTSLEIQKINVTSTTVRFIRDLLESLGKPVRAEPSSICLQLWINYRERTPQVEHTWCSPWSWHHQHWYKMTSCDAEKNWHHFCGAPAKKA